MAESIKIMSLSLCKTFYFCVIEAVMLVIMFVYLKFLMKWKKQKWNLAGRGKGLNFIKEAYLKRLCYVLTKLGNFLATCNAMQFYVEKCCVCISRSSLCDMSRSIKED